MTAHADHARRAAPSTHPVTAGGRTSPTRAGPSHGDAASSCAAAREDMVALARRDWTDVLRDPTVLGLLRGCDGADAATLAPPAFDAFASAFEGTAVARADVTGRTRKAVTLTVAWAGSTPTSTYGLLDVTLAWRDGRAHVRAQATGVGWTPHAVARRHERAPGTVEPGLAIARDLAPHGTTLRIVARTASRMGMTDLHVPTPDGMLLGTLHRRDATPDCASAVASFEGGHLSVRPVRAAALADDGSWWTGVTYVDGSRLGLARTCYVDLWRQLSDDPAVGRLAEVADWRNPGPVGVEALARGEAELRPRAEALLLLARRVPP